MAKFSIEKEHPMPCNIRKPTNISVCETYWKLQNELYVLGERELRAFGELPPST